MFVETEDKKEQVNMEFIMWFVTVLWNKNI